MYSFIFLVRIVPLWSVEELKGYLLHVQRSYQPRLSVEAQKILSCYYRHVRSHNCSGTQATVRLLESLIRLAQAHARLMMRSVVLTMVKCFELNDDVGCDPSGDADGVLRVQNWTHQYGGHSVHRISQRELSRD